MSIACKGNCGRETNNPTGFCTICVMDGKVPPQTGEKPNDAPPGVQIDGQGLMPIKHKGEEFVSNKKCSRDGCKSLKLKFGLCYKHLIAEHGTTALPASMQLRINKNLGGGNTVMRESVSKKAQVSPGQAVPLTKSVQHRNAGGKISEPEIYNTFPEIIMRLREKKAGYLIEIEKINTCLLTIKEHCGADIPGMEYIA